MPFSAFDPVDEDRDNNDIEQNKRSIEQLKQTVNGDVAARVAQIYNQNPYIPASVILAMVKAGVSDQTISASAKAAGQATANQLSPSKPKKQSWFQRNVAGKFKTASRWTFAGLQLTPELVQNVGSQIFSSNDPAGGDGWFKSTTLGSLIADDTQAGTGFFVGGQVAEKQAERAREFRGTVNGHAWTVGRGAASLAFTPGSKPYSILSGFVDAAVQFVDPTIVGGKVRSGIVAGKAAVPIVTGGEELARVSRLAARGAAGLTDAETIAFEGTKFGKWVTTDRRAVRLTNNIVDIAANAGMTMGTKIEKILDIFDYSISPDMAKALAEADDAGKVQGFLGEAAARLDTKTDEVLLPKDVRDIPGAKVGYKMFDSAREKLPFYRDIRNSRYLATMPKENIVINGSGLDKTNAIRSFSRYFQGVGISKDSDEYRTIMDEVVTAFTLTDDPGASRKAVQDVYEKTLQKVFDRAGLNKDSKSAIKAAILKSKEELQQARAYAINDAGTVDDGGFVQMIRKFIPQEVLDEFTPDQWDKLVLNGPAAIAQLADDLLILPDFRQMRRITSSTNFATTVRSGERAGDARFALTATEYIQNEIWKPITLMTGGYIMRNMLDAQTRIAMTGLSGLFNHPLDYIMWVTHKKGKFDVLGGDFEEAFAKAVDDTVMNWSSEMDDFLDAIQFDTYRHLEDSSAARQRLFRTGNFTIVDEATDAKAHTIGYVDNLGQIFGDEVNNFMAKLVAGGVSAPARQQIVKDWLLSPAGEKARAKIKRYLELGVKVKDPDSGFETIIKIGDVTDDVMAAWVEKLSVSRIEHIVRGDQDLAVVAGFNRVPLTEVDATGRTRVVPRFEQLADDLDPNMIVSGTGDAGTLVWLDDGINQGVVVSVSDETGQKVLTIQPVYAEDAFTNDRLGTANLRNFIDAKRVDKKLAPKVTRAERASDRPGGLPSEFQKSKDWVTDKFFKGIYGKRSAQLEKSPLFRQAYYREVEFAADALAPDEAQRLLDNIRRNVAGTKMSAEQYVGSKKLVKKLEDIAASTSDATGTLEDLDDYAKAIALDFIKTTLYNATERNNLEDILRVVIPFGAAWREVIGTYAKAALQDPTRIRRAQLIFDGARKFDPDGDGEGFFYKDATTGDYSFNWPWSGWVSDLALGVEAPLQMPVKRISIGLGVVPSIGPVAQIAYSKLAPDTPSLDFINSVLLPYGRKESMGFVPLWAQRLGQAIEGNQYNLETVFGNTYIETLRALSTSGEYDLKDPNEQEKLYADARQKARVLTALRALGQFVGPTSPTPEFRVDTKIGDMYAAQLVKEFQKLQAENYDTAVSRFLEIYGNDAMLYLSNKTESLRGGLEATEEFGDWERGPGKQLLNRYPQVAAYMAPGGANFSFEVWERQIRGGKRRRLTDQEIVDLAQYRAASAQYRTLREKLPPNPSNEQKAWLRKWRIQLNKEYPGFPAVAEYNPGEFPGTIAEMKRMVQDPSLADNDVATALKEYLEARDKAVARYAEVGGAESGFANAVAAAPLRDWLAQIGRALKVQTPEFARIYDRILANEVDA